MINIIYVASINSQCRFFIYCNNVKVSLLNDWWLSLWTVKNNKINNKKMKQKEIYDETGLRNMNFYIISVDENVNLTFEFIHFWHLLWYIVHWGVFVWAVRGVNRICVWGTHANYISNRTASTEYVLSMFSC